jgi:hypothetical protein
VCFVALVLPFSAVAQPLSVRRFIKLSAIYSGGRQEVASRSFFPLQDKPIRPARTILCDHAPQRCLTFSVPSCCDARPNLRASSRTSSSYFIVSSRPFRAHSSSGYARLYECGLTLAWLVWLYTAEHHRMPWNQIDVAFQETFTFHPNNIQAPVGTIVTFYFPS